MRRKLLLFFLCVSFYAHATMIDDKVAVRTSNTSTSEKEIKRPTDNPPLALPPASCPSVIINGVSYNFIKPSPMNPQINPNPELGPLSFNVTGEVVLVDNGDENGGCATITTDLTGKIALISKGRCPSQFKAQRAQDAGAVGVIIYNPADGNLILSGVQPTLTIPVVGLLRADANAVIVALGMGTVSATLYTNLPKPTLSPDTSPAICAGARSFTIPYTAPVGSPNTYSISGAGITTVTDAPLPANSITVNLSSGATGSSISYTLTVKNSDDCVSDNITGSVTVNPAPSRLYVNVTASGANTGLTWTDAFTDLQSALNYSCNANLTEIWVAKGTYYPTADASGNTSPADPRTKTFVMKNGVAIYGGFVGGEAANYDLSLRNFTSNETILSGDIDGIPDVVTGSGSTLSISGNGGNAIHVITNLNNQLVSGVILDGFTVRGGNANQTGVPNNLGIVGGGMLNRADGVGKICNVSVNNCLFWGNTSANTGGGIYAQLANGGAMYLQLNNCEVRQNLSRNAGGGISNSANLDLSRCTIIGNKVSNTRGEGGGLSNGGILNISQSTISNNAAGYVGGGISVKVFTIGGIPIVNVSNSTISNNVAAFGAGIHNLSSSLTMTNSAIVGNIASGSDPTGGAGGLENVGFINATTANLINCTFHNNQQTSSTDPTADDIYSGNFGSQSTVNLKNTIINGSSATTTPNVRVFTDGTIPALGAIVSQGNNLISDGSSSFTNGINGDLVNVNPLFVSATDVHLQGCSPALNVGDNTANATTTDLDGNSRKFGVIDMGAYEYQSNTVAPPTASASTTTPTICSGNTINLSASGGSSFSWAGPTGSNFSSTDQNPSFMGSSTSYSGLYSVSVSNDNCPLTATATVSVQVNQGLNNPQVSPVAPLCAGTSLLLSASGGTSYSWAGPTFSSALRNPARPAVTTAMAGTYSVTVSADAGCFSVLTVSVQISPMVTAIQKGSNSPVCQGNTLQLSASGGVLYSWKAPDGFSSTEQNPTRTSASAAMSGLYSVTVGNGGTCTVSATLSVSVQAAALSVNPNPLNVCIGQTINLSANASPAASAFSWKGPGNFSSTTQNISTYATTTANLGIYSVSATIGSCTVSASSEVKSGAVLQAGVVGIPCLGGTIQFTASGMTSYTWSRPTNNFNSNLPNPVIPSSSMNDAGIYFLTARSGSCVASALVPVMLAGSGINPTFSLNPSTIAAGATVALSAASASGVYSWSGPSGFSGNTRTKSISNFQVANNGTYRLTLTVGTCTGYTEKNISINSATRLAAAESEEDIDLKINAYPNPVTHTLTVEVRLKEPSKLSLSLFNSIGKERGTWQLNEVRTLHKTELNMSELQGGVYLLQAQADKQKVVKRVMKIQY
ncbi:MAG: PA domain-containing protein [Spirosomataceae bacterium]